jgi:hypothetical protein
LLALAHCGLLDQQGVFALRGGLQPDTVMTIVTMVVAFYFGTQTEGKSNGK